MVFAAVSGDVYEATSPSSVPHHVILRKLWSLAAFCAAGFILPQKGSPWKRVARGGLWIALFSTAIEIAQRIHGSGESLAWNAFDVGCGGAGGAAGAALALLFPRKSK